MAINYTTLFTVLGKYVKSINTFEGYFSELSTDQTDIEGVLEANNLSRLNSGLPTMFDKFKDDIEFWINSVQSETTRVLTDREFIQDNLSTKNTSRNEILTELANDMDANSETIKNSLQLEPTDVAFGSTSKTITRNYYLDNSSSPLPKAILPDYYGSAVPPANGPPSELNTKDVTLYVECISAETEGEETFVIYPETTGSLPYKKFTETPTYRSTLRIADFNAINIVNSDLGAFTVTDVPDGWTMSGGSSTTDYGKYNTTYRGDSALAIKTNSVSMSQNTFVEESTSYSFSCRLAHPDLVDTTDTNPSSHGSVSVTLSVSGHNKDNSTWSESGIENSTISSKWALAEHTFVTNKNHDPTRPVTISLTFSNLSTDNWTIVDEITIVPRQFYDGISYTIHKGQSNEVFEIGDKTSFSYTAVNNGVFQEFFRKTYGLQLPSENSPTIADSLAT